MKIHIKNMVCGRCITAVTEAFREAGHHPESVVLGEVTLPGTLSPGELDKMGRKLESLGFEIIRDQTGETMEKIKTTIIELVHYGKGDRKVNPSTVIETTLGKNYKHLSNLFSSVEGTTIEQYLIRQKIERAKELLVYDELSLSDIAFDLGYSSTAHLSNQFKKVTGLTPTHFKKIGIRKRQAIDKVGT
jgi:AraC-like DNA-binding protein